MKNKGVLRKLISVGVILCLAVSVLVLGCVGDETPPTPTPPTEPQPQYGGVLKVAFYWSPTCLGYPPKMTGYQNGLIARPALEGMVEVSPTGEVIPCLAESWEVADDRLSITFKLRKGVKFHDGTDFNAEAVKFGFELYAPGYVKGLESIDVVDGYTVRFNLSEWHSTILSYRMPMRLVSPTAVETYGEDWCATHPVGTGPFKFVSFERDVNVVYERFDDYWGGKPYLDGFEWVFIADPFVQMAEFMVGNVDGIATVTPKDVVELLTKGDYTVNVTEGLGIIGGFMPNATDPSPWTDVNVRRAACYAIDRQAICDTFGYGYWEPTDQPASYKLWTANPDLEGYPYDPAKARKLLTEAGYPDGFKTNAYIYNTAEDVRVNTAAQAYLAEVGIDCELVAQTSGAITKRIVRGTWDGLLVLRNVSSYPGDTLSLLPRAYHSDSIVWPLKFRNDELDAAFQEMRDAVDFGAQKEATHEALRLLIDEYCVVNSFYIAAQITVLHKHVHDCDIMESDPSVYHPAKIWIER